MTNDSSSVIVVNGNKTKIASSCFEMQCVPRYQFDVCVCVWCVGNIQSERCREKKSETETAENEIKRDKLKAFHFDLLHAHINNIAGAIS